MNFLDPRLPERFWDKCIPEPNSGCWLWLGSVQRDGRGQIKWDRKSPVKAYRLTVALIADLPDDMTVDHRCENPNCVNPHHCDVVTSAENVKLFYARHPECCAWACDHISERDARGRCRACYAARMRAFRAERKAKTS